MRPLILTVMLSGCVGPQSRLNCHRETLAGDDHPLGVIEVCIKRICRDLSKMSRTAGQIVRCDFITVEPPDAEKSFAELAEKSVIKIDAEFCRKAPAEWQRQAFCKELE